MMFMISETKEDPILAELVFEIDTGLPAMSWHGSGRDGNSDSLIR
jgi:hypothetical protein